MLFCAYAAARTHLYSICITMYKSLSLAATLLAALSLGGLTAAAESKDDPAASCSCCTADSPKDEAESWPIRGVVESVLTERNALLVKHEEIPGFMRAMTMMFQVDPALLPKIKPGDNLTATMKRAQPRGWLLEDVKIINP